MDGRVSVSSPLQGERLSDEWEQYKSQEGVVRSGIVHWWYRLTTPARLPPGATVAQHETLRRTRIASILLFFLLLLLVTLVLPAAILTNHRAVLLLVCLLLSLILIAILFNRCGRFQMAGALVACGLSGVFYSSILTNPAGLTIDSLLLFNGPIVAELFIASLLPGSWLFLATLINSLFIVTTLMMIPQTPELAQLMQTRAYLVLMCLVVLHVVVTGVVWLWVHSAAEANERADQVEAIATLSHAIAEQEHAVALEKQTLDSSIGQIMCTHVQVANGNLKARVPVQEVEALQPLAIALNNLLNRFQRLRQVEQEFLSMLPHIQRGKQAEYELQRAKSELELLIRAIHESRQTNRCIRAPRGGTLLDPLFREVNGQYISLLPPYGKSTTTQLPAPDCVLSEQASSEVTLQKGSGPLSA
ncbi:MAG: hypothetical protein JO011_17755 [Ktedonobacteraceae bacterium]|nr:hypothetical protein [Ktedonobacteraceae bacterium]